MAEIVGSARTRVSNRGQAVRISYCQLTLTGIAGFLGTAVYRAYHGDLQALRQRALARSQIARTAAGPIEFSTEGKGSPVLVIHGAGEG